jgi:hypothetical protein
MNATQEMNQCVSPGIMVKSAERFLLQTSLLVSKVGDLSVFHEILATINWGAPKAWCGVRHRVLEAEGI